MIKTDTEFPPEVLQAKQRFSIIGNSTALLVAIERAIRVAPIDLSVLITGESGTGKEFFPKIIHAFSARKHKKYIAVNCGAIPEGTIDSELFGHEKGAFTGAVSTRKGYFEEANGGTIFLDEVAELPLTTQARLLRVLESGEYLKVGSSEVQKTDIRIVAATNVDLAKAVEQGRFREDLFYRLSTIQIALPPLHDRGGDIFLLARKFAADFSEKYLTPPITFSEDARRLMSVYRWPGNVRQLKNVVDQAALFNAGTEVDAAILSTYLPSTSGTGIPMVTRPETPSYESERELLWQTLISLQNEIRELRGLRHQTSQETDITGINTHLPVKRERAIIPYPTDEFTPYSQMPTSLEENEKETIIRALNRNGGKRKNTARELNISERTLYRKIKEFGLDDSSSNAQ